ncbi:MAG TPA: hypothetical protein VF733_03735 [Candidatus Saccharimonadales bacterium]
MSELYTYPKPIVDAYVHSSEAYQYTESASVVAVGSVASQMINAGEYTWQRLLTDRLESHQLEERIALDGKPLRIKQDAAYMRGIAYGVASITANVGGLPEAIDVAAETNERGKMHRPADATLLPIAALQDLAQNDKNQAQNIARLFEVSADTILSGDATAVSLRQEMQEAVSRLRAANACLREDPENGLALVEYQSILDSVAKVPKRLGQLMAAGLTRNLEQDIPHQLVDRFMHKFTKEQCHFNCLACQASA